MPASLGARLRLPHQNLSRLQSRDLHLGDAWLEFPKKRFGFL